ncbi:MAG: PilN domain-containing protein [Phycisphaerales bacterium]
MSNVGAQLGSKRRRHEVVAGIAPTGEGQAWSVVVARSGGGAGVRVLHAATYTRADAAAMRRELAAQKATLVVRVVPTRESVGRVIHVPTAGDADLQRTLRLIVEAETPPNVQYHRVGAAFLPIAAGSSTSGQTRSALLTGWVGAGADARGAKQNELEVGEGFEERFCTPLGAIATLRGADEGDIVDARASEQALSVLVGAGQGGEAKSVARVVIDEPDDGMSWGQIVEATLEGAMELTGEAGSWTGEIEKSWPNGTQCASLLAKRVSGASIDASWMKKHAVALGAACSGLDEYKGSFGFSEILQDAPKVYKPLAMRAAEWASAPGKAGVLIAASLVAMLLVPWGVSYARTKVLETSAKGLADVRSKSKDIELRAAMYQQLEKSRWPMTKLMSDIAGAAPVGLTITEYRATVEQNITLVGEADSRDLVIKFESNLNATRLFSSVTQKNVDPKGTMVEFTYTLVVGPGVHAAAKPAEDFTTVPLAVRLYGEGATNTLPPKGAAPAAVRTTRSASATPGTSVGPTVGGKTNGSTPSSGSESRRPSSSSSSEAPAAVADADIAKMTRSEAMKAWAERKRFLQANAKADPSIKTRLEDEVTKLKTRMDEAAKTDAKPAESGGKK